MSLLETEKKAEERAKAAHNEQRKLTATYANNIAVAFVVLGYITPVLSMRDHLPISDNEAWKLALMGGVCVGASLALHLGAVLFLRRMR